MADKQSNLSSNYFVIAKLCGRPKILWTWKILRRSKSLGVKYCGDEFKEAQTAKLAGEKALRELLNGIGHEKNGVR
jgi:hypothetical protein